MTSMLSLTASSFDSPPPSLAERRDWLLDREEAIAAVVRAGLKEILRDVLSGFEASLTAANWSVLDEIPGRWRAFVSTSLEGGLSGMFVAGSLVSWNVANTLFDPDGWTVDRWAAVVNSRSVEYMRGAGNRLVAVGDATWREVRGVVADAIERGGDLTNEVLKGSIEDLLQSSEFRADTIARTEVMGAYNAGDEAGALALGDIGPVEKAWAATHDARTRVDHVEADGQTVGLTARFVVGGVSMSRPHDPAGGAAQIVNCRCTCSYLWPGDVRPDGSKVPERYLSESSTERVVNPT